MKAVVNSIFGWFFRKRYESIIESQDSPIETQNRVLSSLIDSLEGTEFAKIHGISASSTHASFAQSIPVRTYEEMKPFIDRVMRGEKNVIWPGYIKWFAKSSGTTSDRSKFIPVTKDALEECHFKAGKDMIAFYFNMNPDTHVAAGKSLVLGGSHDINHLNDNSSYGDISAVLMQNLPIWAQLKRMPDLDTALMDDWEQKIDKMAHETLNEDITNIWGVPTWTVVLIKKLFEISGKDNLREIWPNLELYIHGGVSFSPYRELFADLIRGDGMHYMETYNASEGFFGIQDRLDADDMLLMLDYGIYYEFIPADKPNDDPIPLEGVKTGVNYILVISTNAGLWRYQIGDTIRFTSLNPYRIQLTGRTKHFINAFGEELIIDNAERALSKACKKFNVSVKDYTAAPSFFQKNKKACHQWAIEFERAPQDLSSFEAFLDAELRKLNSDYDSKRQGDMALTCLNIIKLPTDTFYNWLKSKGKLGGQNKVPRLSNERKYIDAILEFNKSSAKF